MAEQKELADVELGRLEVVLGPVRQVGFLDGQVERLSNHRGRRPATRPSRVKR